MHEQAFTGFKLERRRPFLQAVQVILFPFIDRSLSFGTIVVPCFQETCEVAGITRATVTPPMLPGFGPALPPNAPIIDVAVLANALRTDHDAIDASP